MINAIQIQPDSRVPKYKQLAFKLSKKIKDKSLKDEAPLPSINQLSSALEVSRDTVEKAYRELRKKDLIEAVPGKGYYVKCSPERDSIQLFVLFNNLSAHTKIIYDSFLEELNIPTRINFHVHNNDFTIFEQLLSENIDKYSYYVITPHFNSNYSGARAIINRIPKHKLILLEKRIDGITGEYACVYQDFEKDLFNALCLAKEHLSKYQYLKLLFPTRTCQPREIINGFQRFCIDHNFKGKLAPEIEEETLSKGEAYITITEDDLVCLVKKIKESQLKVGQEIGILSYNENPLKEVLLDGISALSSDYELLGRTAARMILENRKESFEIPFRLILRKSL